MRGSLDSDRGYCGRGTRRRAMHTVPFRRILAASTVALITFATTPAAAGDVPVWGTVDSPDRGNRQNALAGVAAISPTDVWVVGEYNPGRPPTETGRDTLAEHWDGTSFHIIPTPTAPWAGATK